MPATSSVVGSRAELAPLPWLLLVLLRMCAGAFKFGGDWEEPFVKFSKLYLRPLEMQDVKLGILQIAATEISAARLTESLLESSKEVAQAANQKGEKCIEGNLFFLLWSETAGAGFWGGSTCATINCNGGF